ncbi:hypothetical protein KEM52_006081 [Ascosphaera acerosa]|nr:hypothetical protein KEM52_006081 [Ascosphaera acerosa]
MEIFCRNIPQPISDKRLSRDIRPYLERYGIVTFRCRRTGPRTASITVVDKPAGQKFLHNHGSSVSQRIRPKQPIFLFGQPVYFGMSRVPPEPFLLRSLEQSEESRQAAMTSKSLAEADRPLRKGERTLDILGMSCGVWSYADCKPVYEECYSWGARGTMTFRHGSVKVDLHAAVNGDICTIHLAYGNIRSIFVGYPTPSFTVTTEVPPRLYLSTALDRAARELASMSRLGHVPADRQRVGHFPGDWAESAAYCYSYRFLFRDPKDSKTATRLSARFNAPEAYSWNDALSTQSYSLEQYVAAFIQRLRTEDLPYTVKFQLQALVWNGDLSPLQANSLLSHVRQSLCKRDEAIVARALARLRNELARPAPDVQAEEVEWATVARKFDAAIESSIRETLSEITPERIHPNMVMIHHATITPCAVRLFGPKMEAKNRVLRKYEQHTDCFLRVTFQDEDGGPVRYDAMADTQTIFQTRFKGFLMRGIDIGGRHFSFLGFSHSSLRSQTCWFVAPFRTTPDGSVWDSQRIIDDLGIFAAIRSPSKMAARIGQAFSDTVAAVEIPRSSIGSIPDIMRNQRCFSDGVGKISMSLVRRIWKEYGSKASKRPTVFQIRIAGAKGMVSLDSRLQGNQLLLRHSMIKFPAEDTAIEICGSGVRPLPFCLNQQLIKILEDLNVPPKAFIDLQRAEINRLRSAPTTAEGAAEFLDGTSIPRSAGLAWTIRYLSRHLGLDFRDDPFLESLIELAILIRLRDLKYRARIPVRQAVTLYGVLDETGYLKENEIYCAMTNEDGVTQVLVRDNVVITRSPALHPGDIQVVNAVDANYPEHPLRKLHNCVAFSQYGTRDVPSMLSGGDLDGDLYNVIYDDTLLPQNTYEAADYEPAAERVLDRAVVTDDIIDFFITFMQQDQLGRIATVHQILADQCEAGTRDPQCLIAAALHSTAVDFSKSGVPAQLEALPKVRPYRPDFMAPGPRVRVTEDISLMQLTDGTSNIDYEDPDDDEPRPLLYYKSTKVLGCLFRAVDEQKFFKETRAALNPADESIDVLKKVQQHARSRLGGLRWQHLIERAEGI